MQTRVMRIENWDDAARFGVPLDGSTPLRLGASIVGWLPPDLFRTFHDGTEPRLYKVVMGRKAYDMDPTKILEARVRTYDDGYAYFSKNSDFIASVILNVPVGALDLDAKGRIDYTERTGDVLCSALSDYFRLRETYIQSELHKQEPRQVMDTLLSLDNNNYHSTLLIHLTWRGKELNDLLGLSRMLFMREPKDNYAELFHSVRDATVLFTDFLSFQALGREKHPTKPSWQLAYEFQPENVFLLKAETEAENALGERLFYEERLDEFLKEWSPEYDPNAARTFFFAPAGDCLTDWVVGTTITVSELNALIY